MEGGRGWRGGVFVVAALAACCFHGVLCSDDDGTAGSGGVLVSHSVGTAPAGPLQAGVLGRYRLTSAGRQ